MNKGIVNSSDEIRKLLFRQSEKYNLSFVTVCKYLGIRYSTFKKYAEIKSLESVINHPLSDKDIFKIANALGVNIRVQCIIVNDFEGIAKKIKDEVNGRHKKEKTSSSET